jgi:hypothetical protein
VDRWKKPGSEKHERKVQIMTQKRSFTGVIQNAGGGGAFEEKEFGVFHKLRILLYHC